MQDAQLQLPIAGCPALFDKKQGRILGIKLRNLGLKLGIL